jgi:hypothetical protein
VVGEIKIKGSRGIMLSGKTEAPGEEIISAVMPRRLSSNRLQAFAVRNPKNNQFASFLRPNFK